MKPSNYRICIRPVHVAYENECTDESVGVEVERERRADPSVAAGLWAEDIVTPARQYATACQL